MRSSRLLISRHNRPAGAIYGVDALGSPASQAPSHAALPLRPRPCGEARATDLLVGTKRKRHLDASEDRDGWSGDQDDNVEIEGLPSVEVNLDGRRCTGFEFSKRAAYSCCICDKRSKSSARIRNGCTKSGPRTAGMVSLAWYASRFGIGVRRYAT